MDPYRLKKPSRVFVNSMCDLFHEQMPLDVLQELFDVMTDCPQHIFQILTKRHQRLARVAPQLGWAPTIWMGLSIENQDYVRRADYLRQAPAAVRFISAEPFLERNFSGPTLLASRPSERFPCRSRPSRSS